MSSKEKKSEKIGSGLVLQILIYSILTLLFFVSIYNSALVYIFSMLGIIAVLFVLFVRNYQDGSLTRIFYYSLIIFSLFFLFLPFNIFYEFFGSFFSESIGIDSNFDTILFFFYYGLLTIFAIVSEFIIALAYHYSDEQQIPTGNGIWDYFLKDISIKKVLILLLLLSVASVFEEIVFRFFLLNMFVLWGLPIFLAIIFASFSFGMAHYSNGGWIYIVNSTFAGFIFTFAYIEMGLLVSWLLHFLWNFLVIFQMFLPSLYEKRKKKS